jgi:protein gp37
MPNKTKIEWTDWSSNPLYAVDIETGKRGWHCVHASDGCRHCYAEAINKRFGTGLSYTAQNDSKVRFELSMKECDALLMLDKKLNRQGVTEKVFVGDMLDVFYKNVPDRLIIELYKCFVRCQNLQIQILTKRADRLLEIDNSIPGLIDEQHIWHGVSVEDKKAKWRIDALRETSSHINFLSLEPLLEDLGALDLTGIHWVIVGGESGLQARSCDVRWIRNIVSQCEAVNVPVFVKQLGKKPFQSPSHNGGTGFFLQIESSKGGDISEWPEDLRIRQFPTLGASL